jgi:hypothetical protein
MKTDASTAVLVPCRINVGATWSDACVHEVAPKTIVISSKAAMNVGSYVDVRRGTLIIIGRVIWVRGDRIGIRTQDSVSAAMLVNEPRLTERPVTATSERRGPARDRVALSPAMQAERSRRVSSALQFAALTAATGGGAYLLASQLYVALSVPFARISAALGG